LTTRYLDLGEFLRYLCNIGFAAACRSLNTRFGMHLAVLAESAAILGESFCDCIECRECLENLLEMNREVLSLLDENRYIFRIVSSDEYPNLVLTAQCAPADQAF